MMYSQIGVLPKLHFDAVRAFRQEGKQHFDTVGNPADKKTDSLTLAGTPQTRKQTV